MPCLPGIHRGCRQIPPKMSTLLAILNGQLNGTKQASALLKCQKLLRHQLGVEPSVEPDFSGRTRKRPTGPFFILFWTRFLLASAVNESIAECDSCCVESSASTPSNLFFFIRFDF